MRRRVTASCRAGMRTPRTLLAALLMVVACALAGPVVPFAAAQVQDPSPDPGRLWNAYPLGPQNTPTTGGALAPRATPTATPEGSGRDVFSAVVYGLVGIFVTCVLFLRPWSRRRPRRAPSAAVRAAGAARAQATAVAERPSAEPVVADRPAVATPHPADAERPVVVARAEPADRDHEDTLERLEDLRRSIGRRISDQPAAEADAARREAERRRTAAAATRRRPGPPARDPNRSRRRSRRFARPGPRVLRAPHAEFPTSELRLTRTAEGDGRFLATAPSIDGDPLRVAESTTFPWPDSAGDHDERAARRAYGELVSAMVAAGWEPEGPDGPWLATPEVALRRHG